jgi:hypothetical protein
MSVITRIREFVEVVDTNASPRGGAGIARVDRDTVIPSGTSVGQADLATIVSLTIAGSANSDWDARAALQLSSQGACNGAELVYLRVEIPSSASGTVTMKVAGSNGLDILNGSTDGVALTAGARFTLDFTNAVGPAMDASNRLINFANAGASSVTITIYCLQRSA